MVLSVFVKNYYLLLLENNIVKSGFCAPEKQNC